MVSATKLPSVRGDANLPFPCRLATKRGPQLLQDNVLSESPRWPRNRKTRPENGSISSDASIFAANSLKPLLISVTPASIRARLFAQMPQQFLRHRSEHSRINWGGHFLAANGRSPIRDGGKRSILCVVFNDESFRSCRKYQIAIKMNSAAGQVRQRSSHSASTRSVSQLRLCCRRWVRRRLPLWARTPPSSPRPSPKPLRSSLCKRKVRFFENNSVPTAVAERLRQEAIADGHRHSATAMPPSAEILKQQIEDIRQATLKNERAGAEARSRYEAVQLQTKLNSMLAKLSSEHQKLVRTALEAGQVDLSQAVASANKLALAEAFDSLPKDIQKKLLAQYVSGQFADAAQLRANATLVQAHPAYRSRSSCCSCATPNGICCGPKRRAFAAGYARSSGGR